MPAGKIKCVIFDIGDTIYNSNLVLETARNEKLELKVLEKHGYYFTPDEYFSTLKRVLRDWNSLGFKNKESFISYHLQKYLGIKKPSWKIADEMHSAVLKVCRKLKAKDLELPNAVSIIKWLAKKEYYLGIISDSATNIGRGWLNELQLTKHFHHISISREIGFEKDTPKPFELFIEKINEKYNTSLKPEECLMVGDQENDLRAKLAGMKTCLYNPKGKKHEHYKIKPDFEIRNLKELKKILRRLPKRKEYML